MQTGQIALDAAQGQPQAGPQVGHQAGDAHPQPALPQRLPAQIEASFLPAGTGTAPAPLYLVLGHHHRRRRRQVDHLPTAAHVHPAQATATVGARADRVLHHHTRLVAAPGLVVLRRPFAPRLSRPRGHVRLHKGRRRRFLRFQFADPLQRIRQLLAQRGVLLPQRSVLGLQGRVPVVRNHTSSLTTKVKSEHLPVFFV